MQPDGDHQQRKETSSITVPADASNFQGPEKLGRSYLTNLLLLIGDARAAEAKHEENES